MQCMSGNTGYINSVNQYLLDQTAAALNTLTTAAAEDRKVVVNVATLHEMVSATLTTILAKLTALQPKVNSLENRVGNQDGNKNQANANQGNVNRDNNRMNNNNNESYCHTHGRTRNNDHTSASCLNPAEGHIATLTLQNRDGGSNRYCG